MSLPVPRSRRAHNHHPHLHRGLCACHRCSMSRRFLGECVPVITLERSWSASTYRVCVGVWACVWRATNGATLPRAVSMSYVSVSSCGISYGAAHNISGQCRTQNGVVESLGQSVVVSRLWPVCAHSLSSLPHPSPVLTRLISSSLYTGVRVASSSPACRHQTSSSLLVLQQEVRVCVCVASSASFSASLVDEHPRPITRAAHCHRIVTLSHQRDETVPRTRTTRVHVLLSTVHLVFAADWLWENC
jgi:hypothetical protein